MAVGSRASDEVREGGQEYDVGIGDRAVCRGL